MLSSFTCAPAVRLVLWWKPVYMLLTYFVCSSHLAAGWELKARQLWLRQVRLSVKHLVMVRSSSDCGFKNIEGRWQIPGIHSPAGHENRFSLSLISRQTFGISQAPERRWRCSHLDLKSTSQKWCSLCFNEKREVDSHPVDRTSHNTVVTNVQTLVYTGQQFHPAFMNLVVWWISC